MVLRRRTRRPGNKVTRGELTRPSGREVIFSRLTDYPTLIVFQEVEPNADVVYANSWVERKPQEKFVNEVIDALQRVA